MEVQSTIGTAGEAFKNIFKGVSDEMQMCVQNCLQCAQVCQQMIQHCLSKGGPHAEPAHIRLLQDCAEICAISANFMLRESQFHTSICSACAEICRSCAEDCLKFTDDEMMQACAQICQRCADSCQKMSAAH